MRTIGKVVRRSLWVLAPAFLCFNLSSCKKQFNKEEEIPQIVIQKIFALGFSTENLQKTDEGYLAEGDILLSDSELDQRPETKFLRIADNEQYRTYNLLTALPRTLTISLSNRFPPIYGAALDESIRRYNAENLQIHFQRANSHADVEIIQANGNWVATSGLPAANGTPYGTIKLNPTFMGTASNSSVSINYLATIIAHEIGHCIGFRHTDYMNRSFSCPGRSVNEGTGNFGAVSIPGTPTGSDKGSWMLACIGFNQDRPFNENDKVALNYLY